MSMQFSPSEQEAYQAWREKHFNEFFHDVALINRRKEQESFLRGAAWVETAETKSAYQELAKMHRSPVLPKVQEVSQEKVAAKWFSLFKSAPAPQRDTPAPQHKPGLKK